MGGKFPKSPVGPPSRPLGNPRRARAGDAEDTYQAKKRSRLAAARVHSVVAVVQPLKKVNKYMRRVLSKITLPLLEGGRLSAKKIDSMKDHPELATYLCQSLVLLNDGRLCEIVAVHGEDGEELSFDVRAIGARGKERVRLEAISSKALTRAHVEELQETLISQDDEGFCEGIVATLQRKAEELKNFTFTDADVEEILSRRRQKQGQSCYRSYQSCIQRKMELNVLIDDLKVQLASTDLDRDARQRINQQLKEVELELLRVESAMLEMHHHEEPSSSFQTSTTSPALLKVMKQTPQGASAHMAGGVMSRKRLAAVKQQREQLSLGVFSTDDDQGGPQATLEEIQNLLTNSDHIPRNKIMNKVVLCDTVAACQRFCHW